jgi:hypothetical protein
MICGATRQGGSKRHFAVILPESITHPLVNETYKRIFPSTAIRKIKGFEFYVVYAKVGLVFITPRSGVRVSPPLPIPL